MDRIAVKAKVSKVTIYNHFENKDLLFRQTVGYYLSEVHPGSPTVERSPAKAPREILAQFAVSLIGVTTHQRSIGMLKLLRADPLILANVPAEHHESRLLPDLEHIASYLAWEHGNGRLKVKHVDIAARQFIGMLFENTLYPSLMGMQVDLSKSRVGEVIDSSVAMFLTHYGI